MVEQSLLLKDYNSEHLVELDECMADIVLFMNEMGIKTTSCCCGHGQYPPSIIASDGRDVRVFEFKHLRCARKEGA
jgi:hypothetical protein